MQFTPVQKAFFERLSSPVIGEELFDLFTDQVFFIKDQMARYIVVNQSFIDRCGFQSKSQVIGRTAQDVYPNPFGENYYEQDLMILAEGKGVTNHLELHLYPRNIQGWCLTNKIPIKNSNGSVVGLIGISRDIRDYGRSTDSLADISAAIEYIQKNYMYPLKVVEVAAQFDISLYQFEQKLQRLMHMSPAQFIQKTRLQEATRLLSTTEKSLASVSSLCGYSDQSAFTRMFRLTVGMTPSQFRKKYQTSS